MSDSASMTLAFRYVSDALRTVSTILQASDPSLGDLGFVRYDWDNVWPLDHDRRLHPSRRERWLPWMAFRSYHRPGRPEEEVLTLVAVPFLPDRAGFTEAAFLVSYMEVRDVPDEIFPVAAAQAWDRSAPLDGVARRLGGDFDTDGGWTAMDQRVFERVAGGRVVGAGVPLMDIHTTEDVTRLVRAVMARADSPDGLPGDSPR